MHNIDHTHVYIIYNTGNDTRFNIVTHNYNI